MGGNQFTEFHYAMDPASEGQPHFALTFSSAFNKVTLAVTNGPEIQGVPNSDSGIWTAFTAESRLLREPGKCPINSFKWKFTPKKNDSNDSGSSGTDKTGEYHWSNIVLHRVMKQQWFSRYEYNAYKCWDELKQGYESVPV